MTGSEKLVGEIVEKINELQAGLSRQPWRNASRIVFTNANNGEFWERVNTLTGVLISIDDPALPEKIFLEVTYLFQRPIQKQL